MTWKHRTDIKDVTAGLSYTTVEGSPFCGELSTAAPLFFRGGKIILPLLSYDTL